MDGKNWVYDFNRDLPAGVECTFTLRPGIKTLDGTPLSGEREFSFSTGGPAVIKYRPYEGDRNIDEEQIFILLLDAEADEESILENVYFAVDGLKEKVGVRIIKGEARKELIEKQSNRWFPIEDKPDVVLIKARRSFPNDTKIRLVWGEGVSSISGVRTSKDQKLAFMTRKPFRASFSCSRENPEAGCIPFLPLTLKFTAPVHWDIASRITLTGNGKTYKPREHNPTDGEYVNQVVFDGPFSESSSFTINVPPDIKDDAGRLLENFDKFPLSVATGEYPPLAKFSSRFGIIESADPVLPVTLRNLGAEAMPGTHDTEKDCFECHKLKPVVGRKVTIHDEREAISWLMKVCTVGRSRSLLKGATGALEFKVPKPGGNRAFEVVGIPLEEHGLHIVELESEALGEALLGGTRPMYVPTAALVTNLSAHFKWGRESSLVWVTKLDTGNPVEGASVTLRECDGDVLWEGTTDSNGVAVINKELPQYKDLEHCSWDWDNDVYKDYSQLGALRGISSSIFVFARTDNDMTFVHSSWSDGIETRSFGLPSEPYYYGPRIVHTVFDRTLFRAGETVSMKHVIRNHTMDGFSLPDVAELPKAVSIMHTGSDQNYDFPLEWDKTAGIAETVWKIPEGAKLGFYQVQMLKELPKDEKSKRYYPYNGAQPSGMFRVEEFRIPLMKATVQPPDRPIVGSEDFDVDLTVSYFSGGGAEGLPVTLRTSPGPKYVSFEDYEGFSFANGPVEEGVVESYSREGRKSPELEVTTQQLTLGEGGAIRATVPGVSELDIPRSVLTELEFKDPNGEVQTVSRSVDVWPSEVVVGIKPDSWLCTKDNFKFHVVALDPAGKPLPGVDVKVDLFERKTYSHRKRLIGGFYAYEHLTETKKVGSLCSGTTNEKGLLVCEVISPVTGGVLFQATAMDRNGSLSAANRSVWIGGDEDWWFEVADNDRMDVLPEKKHYENGQTARLQVRMPFKEATALVTVEREGVLDTYVTKLSGKLPVVEIPVKPNYAPNVFVSVLCVRGRSGEFKPTALVDLGKPAFKLGIAEIKVGWQPHELDVDTTVDKVVYKVREAVPVRIKVRCAAGRPLPANAEVAVAAVDEGLLELKDNDSWKLLEAMMRIRGIEVQTSTAQMQVVGKRHYGLKALPSGGGGGRQRTRELFDTLLFWKSRVPLNDKGEAQVTIPLGDSLSSFKIVAVANAGVGLFGTGSASIRTTQDLMLMSGLPQLVRQGDVFTAGFTVRNASEKRLSGFLKPVAEYDGGALDLEDRTFDLAPGKALEVGWDVRVPHGTDFISWDVSAIESKGEAGDRIKVTQKVIPAVPVRVFQATIAQLEKTVRMEVQRPSDAEPDRGGIRVSLRRSLTDELDGVRDYMKRYPYVCMEQKVSKAIALQDVEMWKDVMSDLPSYLDSDGLLKYFPTCPYGSEVLTSYVMSVAQEAGWKIPDGPLGSMQAGLSGFVEGKVNRRSYLPTADLSIRKMMAVEALSRYGKAEPRLLDTISIEPNLWPTSAVLDWLNVLVRLDKISDRNTNLEEAKQILRSRLNFQGTTLGFSSEGSDYLWWLMISADLNASKMVLSVMDFDDWKDDMPRLLRGTVQRQIRGCWKTTTANAWGVLALNKFAEKFESEPITGISFANLDKVDKTLDWNEAVDGGSMMFGWPEGADSVEVKQEGTGKPWVTVQSLAAIPLKEPFSSGYKIVKSVTPIIRKKEGVWSAGDVARVRLELEAQADMTWVVVNDPIPAGSTILGSGLGRDSKILSHGEEHKGWVWPAFEERSFEAFRAYYEYVPKGDWVVEYTVRLNNSGEFRLPETRVEALYSPEMFGELPNERFIVNP